MGNGPAIRIVPQEDATLLLEGVALVEIAELLPYGRQRHEHGEAIDRGAGRVRFHLLGISVEICLALKV